jgi:peptidoglycan/LPS O-acetylase OafA/YrhL
MDTALQHPYRIVSLNRPTNRISSAGRLHIDSLDGLRGLAALYVVLFHVGTILSPVMMNLSTPWRLLHRTVEHGRIAVVTVIVLSGFVLMLPVATTPPPTARDDYFRRRSKRILPPYFAALVICLLWGLLWRHLKVMYASPSLAPPTYPFVEAPNLAGILAHFFLVHNLKRSWVLMVDSTMWTVATEWQIYFFFPLVLLPVWRRFGVAAVIVVALSLGMIPVMFNSSSDDLGTWSPWLLGLFAMGMAAAQTAVSPCVPKRWQAPRLWGIAALMGFIAILVFQTSLPRLWNLGGLWTQDCLNGAAISLLLVYLARCQLADPTHRPILERFFRARVFVFLGAVSYSVYLVHLPILDVVHVLLRNYLAGTRLVTAMFLLGTPIAVIFGYGFHLLFEKPTFLEYCSAAIRLLRRPSAAFFPAMRGPHLANSKLPGAAKPIAGMQSGRYESQPLNR